MWQILHRVLSYNSIVHIATFFPNTLYYSSICHVAPDIILTYFISHFLPLNSPYIQPTNTLVLYLRNSLPDTSVPLSLWPCCFMMSFPIFMRYVFHVSCFVQLPSSYISFPLPFIRSQFWVSIDIDWSFLGHVGLISSKPRYQMFISCWHEIHFRL